MIELLQLIGDIEALGSRLYLSADGMLRVTGELPDGIRARIIERRSDLAIAVLARKTAADLAEIRKRIEALEQRVGPTKEEARRERTIAVGLRFDVLRRDRFQCVYCGVKGTKKTLRVDHIVPVSKGGKSTLENLTTACEPCNAGKSDKVLNLVPQRGLKPARPVVRPKPLEVVDMAEVARGAGQILEMLKAKSSEGAP